MEWQNGTATPLTNLKPGEKAIIVSIQSNPHRGHHRRLIRTPIFRHGFEKRLMDMGLTPGTEVAVINSAPFHGPVEVLVRGARLALGRGMAERILVQKAK
jgi:Fe2+ transport system protein FeoA